MKLNFEQHAVRLGERARPGFARAQVIVITIASLACAHVVLAQTDNPPDATASSVATPTDNPTAIPVVPVPPESPIIVTPPVAAPLPTNSPPVAAVPGSTETNAPVVASAPVTSGSSTNVSTAPRDDGLWQIGSGPQPDSPDLGATAYSVSQAQIESEAQGDNAPFNQVVFRAPGVAQDSAVNGDLHVRGEHANLQYRINDVLLPEGITGFGLELDPRFVSSMQLIDGALPAEYGFRTAGIVDIQTKDGFENGGEADMYGGSYDTLRPSFEYGGTQGKLSYFVDGSYDQNGIGIENPIDSAIPTHDDTKQYKGFTYLSYILDDTSRISLLGSASYSTYQIPNALANRMPRFRGAWLSQLRFLPPI